MAKLYLMRHGQTEYNLLHKVQGRCDSPLTAQGRAQAKKTASWFGSHGIIFDRIVASPLGRALETARIVRDSLQSTVRYEMPSIEIIQGLQERSFGTFEGGSISAVPADVWEPFEALVPYGGEGSEALRTRMVETLSDVMSAGCSSVLAISHGSASMQFKCAWEPYARCEQNVALGNCCVLVYEYERDTGVFSCVEIHNLDDCPES